MKYNPPRIVIRSELFEEHYLHLKNEGTHRIEEWIEGCEYSLPRSPKKGELIAAHKGKEILANKYFDMANKRYILIYHTYDDEKVIFLDIREGEKQA
ncbi:MAG: hypothetical protein AB1656_03700 [Candidatus Omnitrophota bacterium]